MTGSQSGGPSQWQIEQQNAAAAQEEAERQRIEQRRQEEAERRVREAALREAQFLQDRDAAAASLKGSTSANSGQLKGIANSNTVELKGSSSELKGVSATSTAELKESTASSGNVQGIKDMETCHPSQDPSVVDLCFLGDKPAVIDPQLLKGMAPAERTAVTTSAKNMAEDLLPFDKEMYQALADMMGAAPTNTGKQWPGPKNPGTRLLNPLSEPEKVKAYWDKVNAGLHAHAEAEAKIVAAPKGIDWRDLIARQDADPKFKKSKEQIISNQDQAEAQARHQAYMKFKEFLEKQGGPDWPDRLKNDNLFIARMAMERDALFKQMDQELYSIRGKALQQMTVLVRGWKDSKQPLVKTSQ